MRFYILLHACVRVVDDWWFELKLKALTRSVYTVHARRKYNPIYLSRIRNKMYRLSSTSHKKECGTFPLPSSRWILSRLFVDRDSVNFPNDRRRSTLLVYHRRRDVWNEGADGFGRIKNVRRSSSNKSATGRRYTSQYQCWIGWLRRSGLDVRGAVDGKHGREWRHRAGLGRSDFERCWVAVIVSLAEKRGRLRVVWNRHAPVFVPSTKEDEKKG